MLLNKEEAPPSAANTQKGIAQSTTNKIPPLFNSQQAKRRNLKAETEAIYINAGTNWLRLVPFYWLGYKG